MVSDFSAAFERVPALDLRMDQAINRQLQQMRDGTLDNNWQRLVPRLA